MREQDEQLIQFCTDQSCRFNTEQWIQARKTLGSSIEIAALLLSSTAWYPSSSTVNELCRLQQWQQRQLPGLVKSERFDVPRFLPMLKRSIEIRNLS